METFSFKISDKEIRAMEELANRWGSSRAETARRAIQLAHKVTQSDATPSVEPGRLQELIVGQNRLIDLLIELTKFGPLAAKINRLEEYTVQACLSAGVLAKQAGVFESAKKEYNAWKLNRESCV